MTGDCYDLPNLHTRVLLEYLRKARICNGIGYDPTCNNGAEISIVALKAELATREHVPNIPESKEIRRKAAAARGHGKKRNHKPLLSDPPA